MGGRARTGQHRGGQAPSRSEHAAHPQHHAARAHPAPTPTGGRRRRPGPHRPPHPAQKPAPSTGRQASVTTGKPLSIGGSEGRNEATARGAVYTIIEAAKHLNMDLEGARVVVQGFGNAGSFSAKLMAELGAVIVGLSDTSGAIANPKGLDPNRVDAYKRETGSVTGFTGAERISNAQLLELDCDILIPAAIENQIGEHNAPRTKAN